MKTITIGYTKFAVPSNWTTKQLGEFAAQLADLSIIESNADKIGDKWVTAYYLSSDKGVTIGSFEEQVLANYTAARQRLDEMKAAAPAEQETETA